MATFGAHHLKMTTARKQAFLRAFKSAGGSWSRACREVAVGHTKTEIATMRSPPASSTWRVLIRQDLDFARQFDEAKQEIKDALVEMLHERATEGVKNRVYQKGGLVMEPVFDDDGNEVLDADGNVQMVPATTTQHNPAWLLSRLRAVAPEEYGDHKTVDVNVRNASSRAWQIDPSEVHVLSAKQRTALADIIQTVQAARSPSGIAAPVSLPPPADEIVDAEFSEVGRSSIANGERDYADFDLGEDGLREVMA
jgi:hypothetical protein